MKCPLDLGHFKTHAKRCRPKPGQTGLQTVASMFLRAPAPSTDETGKLKLKAFRSTTSRETNATQSPQVVSQQRPCIGLNATNDPRVAVYLKRVPGVEGGGSKSRTVVAKSEFGCDYSELSKADQAHVNLIRTHQRVWRNDIPLLSIFSASCSGFVSGPNNLQICGSCSGLRSNETLQKALNRSPPDDKNKKFTNFEYRAELQGHHFVHTEDLGVILDPVRLSSRHG
jgi:hypothetical protein